MGKKIIDKKTQLNLYDTIGLIAALSLGAIGFIDYIKTTNDRKQLIKFKNFINRRLREIKKEDA